MVDRRHRARARTPNVAVRQVGTAVQPDGDHESSVGTRCTRRPDELATPAGVASDVGTPMPTNRCSKQTDGQPQRTASDDARSTGPIRTAPDDHRRDTRSAEPPPRTLRTGLDAPRGTPRRRGVTNSPPPSEDRLTLARTRPPIGKCNSALKGNTPRIAGRATACCPAPTRVRRQHGRHERPREHGRTERRDLRVAARDTRCSPAPGKVFRLRRDTARLDGVRTSKENHSRHRQHRRGPGRPQHLNHLPGVHWSVETV